MEEAVPGSLCSVIMTLQTASAEAYSDIDGYSPHQADGQETSSVSRKRHSASRLPVRGSISSLIHGAAVGTVWCLTFARPGRGFYSNHLFSIIEWWIASLTSSFKLSKHFQWLIPPWNNFCYWCEPAQLRNQKAISSKSGVRRGDITCCQPWPCRSHRHQQIQAMLLRTTAQATARMFLKIKLRVLLKPNPVSLYCPRALHYTSTEQPVVRVDILLSQEVF